LNEAKIVSTNKILSKLYDPVRVGLIVSLIFGLISIGKRGLIPITQNYMWISSLIIILVTMYLVNTIIKVNFLVNYKTGLAIGIISIIYFISQYYYDLSLTLLTKSIILFVSGMMFLLFYFFTAKNLSTNEKI